MQIWNYCAAVVMWFSINKYTERSVSDQDSSVNFMRCAETFMVVMVTFGIQYFAIICER